MGVFQVFVRSLHGKTHCLQFRESVVSCDELKSRLFKLERVPVEFQRLVTGTRVLPGDGSLCAGPDGWFPTCTVLLGLRGGKGGFGSLLRGAATKAGQKKTSNFDACRDMSGRRLRHVNAEKKLKEWKMDAKERELEKTAEDFLKKKQKMKEEDAGVTKELEKFRAESFLAREEVGSAVEVGLVAAKQQGFDLKRKKDEAVDLQIKRARTWMDEESASESDSDSESDESTVEDDLGKEGGSLSSEQILDKSGKLISRQSASLISSYEEAGEKLSGGYSLSVEVSEVVVSC